MTLTLSVLIAFVAGRLYGMWGEHVRLCAALALGADVGYACGWRECVERDVAIVEVEKYAAKGRWN